MIFPYKSHHLHILCLGFNGQVPASETPEAPAVKGSGCCTVAPDRIGWSQNELERYIGCCPNPPVWWFGWFNSSQIWFYWSSCSPTVRCWSNFGVVGYIDISEYVEKYTFGFLLHPRSLLVVAIPFWSWWGCTRSWAGSRRGSCCAGRGASCACGGHYKMGGSNPTPLIGRGIFWGYCRRCPGIKLKIFFRSLLLENPPRKSNNYGGKLMVIGNKMVWGPSAMSTSGSCSSSSHRTWYAGVELWKSIGWDSLHSLWNLDRMMEKPQGCRGCQELRGSQTRRISFPEDIGISTWVQVKALWPPQPTVFDVTSWGRSPSTSVPQPVAQGERRGFNKPATKPRSQWGKPEPSTGHAIQLALVWHGLVRSEHNITAIAAANIWPR